MLREANAFLSHTRSMSSSVPLNTTSGKFAKKMQLEKGPDCITDIYSCYVSIVAQYADCIVRDRIS